jgi:carbamoyl-phosphate synthase large subunit
VNDFDKSAAIRIGRDLYRMGFKLFATAGTAVALERIGLPVEILEKAFQPGKTTVKAIESGEIQLLINTPLGQQAYADQSAMYAAAIKHSVPLITTLSAAHAAVNGIRALREKDLTVRSLQKHHAQ